MKKIYISFNKVTDKSTIVELIIAWWTRGPYYHSEIVIDKETVLKLYPELEDKIDNIIINNYKKKHNIKHTLLKPVKKEYLEFSSSYESDGVRILYTDIDRDGIDYKPLLVKDRDINDIVNFYKIILGKPYDKLAILGFVIPIQDRINKWFCSETVTNALKIIGIKKVWFLEPYKSSPNVLAYTLDMYDKDGYGRIHNLPKLIINIYKRLTQ